MALHISSTNWSTLTLLHSHICESEIRAMPVWVSQWIFFSTSFEVVLSTCRSCIAYLCCGCTVPSLDVREALHSYADIQLRDCTITSNFCYILFHRESYSLLLFYFYVFFLKLFLKVMLIFLLCSTVWDSVVFFFFSNFFLSGLLIPTSFLRLFCWEPVPANHSHGLIRIEYLIL